jgi:hypothetical protein
MIQWNDINNSKSKHSEKHLSQCSLAHPDLRSELAETNHLMHGTATLKESREQFVTIIFITKNNFNLYYSKPEQGTPSSTLMN